MTNEELVNKRDEICFKLVDEVEQLEQELMWIEELLNERLGRLNEKN
jgi:hypothetical protein